MQERIANLDLGNRLDQQSIRILVRDHSLRKFQVHEAQICKESALCQVNKQINIIFLLVVMVFSRLSTAKAGECAARLGRSF